MLLYWLNILFVCVYAPLIIGSKVHKRIRIKGANPLNFYKNSFFVILDAPIAYQKQPYKR